jgi:hypothetical protein
MFEAIVHYGNRKITITCLALPQIGHEISVYFKNYEQPVIAKVVKISHEQIGLTDEYGYVATPHIIHIYID